MLRITHPRPAPGRQSFIGVEFRDGVAEVESLHPERALALTQHGYTIEEIGILFDDHEASAPFEALPEAVEGDNTPRVSRRRKKA